LEASPFVFFRTAERAKDGNGGNMDDISDRTKRKEQGARKEWVEWAKALFVAGVIVYLASRWLVMPTVVSGSSMEPNLRNGERIILNRIVYAFHPPQRGDIIVFRLKNGKELIKRIIALPGENVMVLGDSVYINGRVLDEPYLRPLTDEAKRRGTTYNLINFKVTGNGIVSVNVPERALFVMGDNRSESKDSRSPDIGFVSLDDVVGRADAVFWPLTDIRFISNDREAQ